MKKLLLSISILFAQSIVANEDQVAKAFQIALQAESISEGSLSESNEKFIRDFMQEIGTDNPTLQIRKPLREIMDVNPIFKLQFYPRPFNYWYINEDFFNTLTDGEKKVMLSMFLFEIQPTSQKVAEAKSWIAPGLFGGLIAILRYSLKEKNTLCGYQLTTFKRWGLIGFGAGLGAVLFAELPLYIYEKIFAKNAIFEDDRIRAERLNDYQSVISYFEKVRKAIEPWLVHEKEYWQLLYGQLPARIEKLEKLAQKVS